MVLSLQANAKNTAEFAAVVRGGLTETSTSLLIRAFAERSGKCSGACKPGAPASAGIHE